MITRSTRTSIISGAGMIARINTSKTIMITGTAMVARIAGTPMTIRGFFDHSRLL